MSAPVGQDPDFAALFAVCTCRRWNCEDCQAWQLTPRTAAALWVAAQLTADEATTTSPSTATRRFSPSQRDGRCSTSTRR